MPQFTVLIPTHNHRLPLAEAVRSVLAQTVADFELLIVGDGVIRSNREFIGDIVSWDPRIRFLDYPKGSWKGEAHRHTALQEARGQHVAYLGDDDVWMPDHLEIVGQALQAADFCHTMHISINAKTELVALSCDLQNEFIRNRMLSGRHNYFDFSFGAHTLESYRRLAGGWHTFRPTDQWRWSDLYVWCQFLSQDWVRAHSVMIPTGICTWTHLRPDLSDDARAQELVEWRRRFAEPGCREHLLAEAARQFAHRLIQAEEGQQQSRQHQIRAEERRQEMERQLEAILKSRSWRWTAPLRALTRPFNAA